MFSQFVFNICIEMHSLFVVSLWSSPDILKLLLTQSINFFLILFLIINYILLVNLLMDHLESFMGY